MSLFAPKVNLPERVFLAAKLPKSPDDGLWRPFEGELPGVCVALKQIHSAEVHIIRDPEDAVKVNGAEGDGLVAIAREIALVIRVADCAPVLMVSRDSSAVALVHAGWRGTRAGILENTVGSLRKLGIAPADLFAFIGPAIGFEDYEVGEEFFEYFPDTTRLFENRPHFDLYREIRNRLISLGVSAVEYLPVSTYSADYLHSYRRDGARSGRNEFFAWLGK